MEQIIKDVGDEIFTITSDAIKNLSNLWTVIFDDDVRINNLHKLVEHVQTFYQEIFDETEERRKVILQSIKKLLGEASELKRLLNVDIQLDSQDNKSLYAYQMELDENLNSLRQLLRDRKEQINNLLSQQDELCMDLDQTSMMLHDDPLPSVDELEEFKLHLEELRKERYSRLQTIQEIRKNCNRMCHDIDIKIESAEDLGYHLLNDVNLKPTMNNITRLRNFEKNLQKRESDILKDVHSKKSQLLSLWKYLDEPSELIDRFLKLDERKLSTLNALHDEKHRCEKLYRDNIEKIINKIRQEITVYWGKTMKSEQERSRFVHFNSNFYTEDLLSLHEMELDDLRNFYENNEKIFKKYCERQELWNRFLALEAKENEPGRYTNRGGQLLKEEKERRALSTKLPKIENEIIELIQAYEVENNRKFLIWGEGVDILIDLDWKKHIDEKEKLKSVRKADKQQQQITPNGIQRSMIKTPMSLMGTGTRAQTSSIKRMASNTQLTVSSIKKHKLNIPSIEKSSAKKLKQSEQQSTVKRNLLTELNSNAGRTPNKFVKPLAGMIKKPQQKRRVISTLTDPSRRSNPLNRSKRKSGRRSNRIPKIEVHDYENIKNEETITSESISYEKFEDHISSRTPCRSSILLNGQQQSQNQQQQQQQQILLQAHKTEIVHLHNNNNNNRQLYQQLGNTPLKLRNHISTLSIPIVSAVADVVNTGTDNHLNSHSSTKKFKQLKYNSSLRSPRTISGGSPASSQSIQTRSKLTTTNKNIFI